MRGGCQVRTDIRGARGNLELSLFRSTIDGDGDGDISKEEFVKNGMQSKFIADLLTKQQYND